MARVLDQDRELIARDVSEWLALHERKEMLVATTSERQGRVIDHDQSASREKKKQEGYF